MSKIIIKNESSVSDLNCLILVHRVMEKGRISNNGKQYCYVTEFTIGEHTVAVVTDLNKSSDKFSIYDTNQ